MYAKEFVLLRKVSSFRSENLLKMKILCKTFFIDFVITRNLIGFVKLSTSSIVFGHLKKFMKCSKVVPEEMKLLIWQGAERGGDRRCYPYPEIQKRIYSPVEYLRWTFLQKQLTANKRYKKRFIFNSISAMDAKLDRGVAYDMWLPFEKQRHPQ